MSEVIEWVSCPICNKPLNPNDYKEAVDFKGQMIHIVCVERAEQLERHNPNNSYT